MQFLFLAGALALLTLSAFGQTATGDAPLPDEHSTAINTATVPMSRIEIDNYDWWKRHAHVLEQKDAVRPQIVLIGDSITHHWGGPPVDFPCCGPVSWKETFHDRRVLNLGFGFDRTQNVLWRLDHGEFDGLSPEWVVINIGTNNLLPTPNARANTPQEIADGIMAICAEVHAKSPTSKIILMAIFPRDLEPNGPHRVKAAAVNAILAEDVKAHPELMYLDIGTQFLQPDGTLPKDMMSDGTHPTDKGYAIWGHALVAAGIRS